MYNSYYYSYSVTALTPLVGEWKGIWSVKILHQKSPKIILWDNFGGPGLTWSNLQKRTNWTKKPKLLITLNITKPNFTHTKTQIWGTQPTFGPSVGLCNFFAWNLHIYSHSLILNYRIWQYKPLQEEKEGFREFNGSLHSCGWGATGSYTSALECASRLLQPKNLNKNARKLTST